MYLMMRENKNGKYKEIPTRNLQSMVCETNNDVINKIHNINKDLELIIQIFVLSILK